MTGWFGKISLRWKLAAVTVLATTVALILSGIIMALYDARTYEAQKVGAITSEAEILAGSVAAALIFNDPDAALEYMTALNANPEIVAAAAYDVTGVLVTSYIRPGTGQNVPDMAGPRGLTFQDDELGVFVPVVENETPVGTVYLKARVEPVAVRLARYTLILLLIGAGALGIALPISLWLHRLISNPIEELAARNAIIRTTLDSVDHGVMVVGQDKKVAFLNDRVSALFMTATPIAEGMDFEALLRDAHDSVGGAYRREMDREYWRSSDHVRDQYTLPDGRTIEYRQAPLARGGFVRTFTDISEEKLMQERLQQAKVKAEEAAKAKSQFLAAMSHEIRTPMSGVVGIVELLRATPLNDEQRQMVELIQRSGIGLLDVINDILDYSKIEAGRMTVEKADCVLADIVETTAEVIGGHTQSKTINITCTVDTAIDAVVKGDPVRIRQIILNLMGNAVKFTETGSVAITARAEKVTDTILTVLFEVTDTGMGIPEEKQKQLFQPFSQADYSTTRKFGGTGLGLSISRNLVELMDGEIGVKSVPGKGSTFWFRVPFTRLPAQSRRDPLGEYTKLLAGLRIFVYDPTQPNSSPAMYLRAVGAEVAEPQTVDDVLRLLAEAHVARRNVDAVVACVRIGDAEVARLIAAMNGPENPAKVKTIVIAPHLSGSAAKIANAQGSSAVLSAPIRRIKLFDAVAALTGRGAHQRDEGADVTGLSFVPPRKEDAAARSCLILVAEDNQTNQFVIKSQMQRLGFAADFVNDGREAWEAISRDESRYALLITDCHMPFIDGYQLTGLIRDRELKSGRRLPVVALTANALQGEAEICRAAGMDGYMFKPTDLATLDAMVLKWVPEAAAMRRALTATPAVGGPLPTAIMQSLNGEALNGAEALQANGQATGWTQGHGQGPPIDTSILASLLGSSEPAALREMLLLYLETEMETPATLRMLGKARDSDGLAKTAHAAKGAASSAGARHLMRLCMDIEKSAGHHDWPTVARLSSEIDAAFADVRKFIEAY